MEINLAPMGVISEVFFTAEENETLRPLLAILLSVRFHPVVKILIEMRFLVGLTKACDESYQHVQ